MVIIRHVTFTILNGISQYVKFQHVWKMIALHCCHVSMETEKADGCKIGFHTKELLEQF